MTLSSCSNSSADFFEQSRVLAACTHIHKPAESACQLIGIFSCNNSPTIRSEMEATNGAALMLQMGNLCGSIPLRTCIMTLIYHTWAISYVHMPSCLPHMRDERHTTYMTHAYATTLNKYTSCMRVDALQEKAIEWFNHPIYHVMFRSPLYMRHCLDRINYFRSRQTDLSGDGRGHDSFDGRNLYPRSINSHACAWLDLSKSWVPDWWISR